MRHTRRVRLPLFAALLSWLAVAAPHAQRLDEAALRQLEWRAIGPAVMGGRIDDLAVDERNPSTIYVGAASGGRVEDHQRGHDVDAALRSARASRRSATSPSAPLESRHRLGRHGRAQQPAELHVRRRRLQVARRRPHVERTWACATRSTSAASIIDPVDSDTVYVAALGRLWGPNAERGVFKTTDGGRTWTNVKFIDQDTGFVDMVMDPNNRNVLYAAAYQRRRAPWGFNGGGPGSGIYKTSRWRAHLDQADQRPARGHRRPHRPGRLAPTIRASSTPPWSTATAAAPSARTTAGTTWQKMSDVNPRPMYYSKIHIDPTNDRRIYVLGASLFVSDDGGRTFADPATGRAGRERDHEPDLRPGRARRPSRAVDQSRPTRSI